MVIFNLIVVLNNEDEDLFVMPYTSADKANAAAEEMEIEHPDLDHWAITVCETDYSIYDHRVYH